MSDLTGSEALRGGTDYRYNCTVAFVSIQCRPDIVSLLLVFSADFQEHASFYFFTPQLKLFEETQKCFDWYLRQTRSKNSSYASEFFILT
jgi:hypothetical protein